MLGAAFLTDKARGVATIDGPGHDPGEQAQRCLRQVWALRRGLAPFRRHEPEPLDARRRLGLSALYNSLQDDELQAFLAAAKKGKSKLLNDYSRDLSFWDPKLQTPHKEPPGFCYDEAQDKGPVQFPKLFRRIVTWKSDAKTISWSSSTRISTSTRHRTGSSTRKRPQRSSGRTGRRSRAGRSGFGSLAQARKGRERSSPSFNTVR